MNSIDILKIGNEISNQVGLLTLKGTNNLIIEVDKDYLKKIDEDLYYRLNPNGKDFIPTEGELNINFPNLIMTIKSK